MIILVILANRSEFQKQIVWWFNGGIVSFNAANHQSTIHNFIKNYCYGGKKKYHLGSVAAMLPAIFFILGSLRTFFFFSEQSFENLFHEILRRMIRIESMVFNNGSSSLKHQPLPRFQFAKPITILQPTGKRDKSSRRSATTGTSRTESNCKHAVV